MSQKSRVQETYRQDETTIHRLKLTAPIVSKLSRTIPDRVATSTTSRVLLMDAAMFEIDTIDRGVGNAEWRLFLLATHGWHILFWETIARRWRQALRQSDLSICYW